MATYPTWREAHGAAVEMANASRRETGILKRRDAFARADVFEVLRLPNPCNRSGFELRCEIVRPGDPR